MSYFSFKEDEDFRNGKEDYQKYGRSDYSRETYRTQDDAYFDGFNEAKKEHERKEERQREERQEEERQQHEDYLRHQEEIQIKQDEEAYYQEQQKQE